MSEQEPEKKPAADTPVPEVENPEEDAAALALSRARHAASMRGEVRRKTPGATLSGASARPRRPRMAANSFGSGRDPQGVGAVMGRLVADRGWGSPVAVGSVMSRWPEFVGRDVAAHCSAEAYDGAVLVVQCDSTAWAANLRLLRPALMEKFRSELGAGVVTEIQILAPNAPSWKKGLRSVRGRGPRDTYG